jgi:Heavy metal associated domain 2
MPTTRYVQLVHALPGRARFRVSWLRRDREEARRIAEQVASLPGIREVRVKPGTGSVLCTWDPARLDVAPVEEAVRGATAVERVLAPNEKPPIPSRAEFAVATSRVAGVTAALFKELDEEVLLATDGRLDLGTVTALGFFGAGALEVAVKGTIPAPPWFNLAWWGLSTFLDFEKDAIRGAREAAQAEMGEAATRGGGS